MTSFYARDAAGVIKESVHGIHGKTRKGKRLTLFYKEESYRIIGACFEVYKEKGCGFLEAVYQECLEMEFGIQEIPFAPQSRLSLSYKGQALQQTYTPDFLCFGKIIVEIKALGNLAGEHRAQVLNYLKATGFKLAFLVNFGHHPKLDYERIVR
jgi:GxxExxY protein